MSKMQQMLLGSIAVAVPPVIEFLGNGIDTANGPSYSWTSKDFGVATSDRLIVVCFAGFRAATRNLSTCTIGGESATVNMNYGSGNSQLAIASANVPSGTSGTIASTFSGDFSDMRYAWWSIKGLSSFTPTITDQIIQASGAITHTVSPDPNTAIIAHCNSYSGSSTFTWSGTLGIVEDGEQYQPNVAHGFASLVHEAGGASLTAINTGTDAGTSNRRSQLIGFN